MTSDSRPPIRAAIAAPIAVLVALSIFLSVWIVALLHNESWVDHTHAVLAQVSGVESLILRQQSALRGYFITADPAFLKRFDDAAPKLKASLDSLAGMTVDNASQQNRIRLLRGHYADWMERASHDRANAVALTTDPQLLASVRIRQQQMQNMENEIASMVSEEERLLAERQATASRTTRNLFIFILLFLIVASAVLLWFLRRKLAEIENVYRGLLADRDASAYAERDARLAAEALATDVRAQLEEAERMILSMRGGAR